MRIWLRLEIIILIFKGENTMLDTYKSFRIKRNRDREMFQHIVDSGDPKRVLLEDTLETLEDTNLERMLVAKFKNYFCTTKDNWEVMEKLIIQIPSGSAIVLEIVFNIAIQQRRVETVRGFLCLKRHKITQGMINHALVTRCGDLTSPNANGIEATDIEKDNNIITSLIGSANGKALYNEEVIQYVKDHNLQSFLEERHNQIIKIYERYFQFCVSNIKLGYIELAIEQIKNMKDDITPEDTEELINLLTECRAEDKSFLNTQSYDMAMNMLRRNINISQGPDNQERTHVENLQQVSGNQIGK